MSGRHVIGCACTPRATLASVISGALILNKRSVYIRTCTMAHSYKPRRTNAYSEDLRWRMVWQRKALGCQIASNLGIDKSTVQRTVQLFLNSGSVCKRPYPKEKSFRKLTLPAQLFILNLAVDNPAMYLDEIQRQLEVTLMLEVSISTICRFLGMASLERSCRRWHYSRINS